MGNELILAWLGKVACCPYGAGWKEREHRGAGRSNVLALVE